MEDSERLQKVLKGVEVLKQNVSNAETLLAAGQKEQGLAFLQKAIVGFDEILTPAPAGPPPGVPGAKLV